MNTTEQTDKVDRLALLLIFLSSWEEKVAGDTAHKAWKGYDFDILDRLEEKGYISQSRTAKSLYLTEAGLQKAKELQRIFDKC